MTYEQRVTIVSLVKGQFRALDGLAAEIGFLQNSVDKNTRSQARRLAAVLDRVSESAVRISRIAKSVE